MVSPFPHSTLLPLGACGIEVARPTHDGGCHRLTINLSMRTTMHARPMSHPPTTNGKQKTRRILSPEQRTLIRELNEKMLYAARDVKPQTDERWVFDNAAAGRYSPASDFACAIDQLLRTSASTDDIAAIFEHGAVLVRARRAEKIAPPVVAALLAQTRAECIENPLQDEVIADPNCPVKRRRLVTVMSNTISKSVNALAALLHAEHRAAS